MSAPVTIPVNTVAPPSTTTPVEVICVIRSPEDPSKTQTVTIRNPSPDLLKQIYQANQASNERWQSVPARTANVRAQSPR